MNDIDKMPSKCHDCPYWEACDYPYICPDVGRVQPKQNADSGKMVGDCISRQAAIDALEREKSLVERPITETRWFDFGLRKAQDVLSELPSAQPEIVRCKDCRWKNKHFCNRAVELFIHDEDFCSWAERLEE